MRPASANAGSCVELHDANCQTERLLADIQRRTLADIELQRRDDARQAAGRCAQAILTYASANPYLLSASALPVAEADELRRSLTGYVDTLRALGTPPERVIIAVKQLVMDAAAAARIDTRGLTGAAVTWAIAAYFPADRSRAQ